MSTSITATPIPTTFDERQAEGFADRVVEILNDGALCLMTSLGHRTGLFDTLAEMDPATSDEIAERADLQERYVREWLGAMTVGEIVEHDPTAGTYHLPPEHAASLSRRSPTDNIAVFAQYIPLLGSVEDDIVRCFREGGGVPYQRFGRFHEIMAEDSGQSVVPALESHILPLVPGLVDRLERGIHVLDAGCGRGRALNTLASRFPRSRFTGYDLSEEAIAVAHREAEALGNTHATFEVRDLSDFDHTSEPAAFDLITTFDAVHDQADPPALLRGIRVLDAGCGRGHALNILASRFPRSHFTGYDLSEEAIAVAQHEAEALGNTNATFEVRDLSDFDHTAEPAAFDLITTFDAVHDQADPPALLRGIRRALADDGVYLAQDIKGSSHHHQDRDHPIGPLLYTLSCMHCMTVSLAQGGEGLGAMWGQEKAQAYFRAAGFTDIAVHELDHDFQNYWYVCRP